MSEQMSRPNNLLKWIILVLILVVLLLIAGFATKRSVTTKNDVKVTPSSSNAPSAVWPTDIPSAVPQFSAGIISSATATTNSVGRVWTVVCQGVEMKAYRAYIVSMLERDWQFGEGNDGKVVNSQLKQGNLEIKSELVIETNTLTMNIQEMTQGSPTPSPFPSPK